MTDSTEDVPEVNPGSDLKATLRVVAEVRRLRALRDEAEAQAGVLREALAAAADALMVLRDSARHPALRVLADTATAAIARDKRLIAEYLIGERNAELLEACAQDGRGAERTEIVKGLRERALLAALDVLAQVYAAKGS